MKIPPLLALSPVSILLAAVGISMFLGCRAREAERDHQVVEVMIPPYLDYVVLDLESVDPQGVEVSVPSSSEPTPLAILAASIQRWSPDLSTVLIRRPHAGRWRFSSREARWAVRLRESSSFLLGHLLAPPRSIPRGRDTCRFDYQVTERSGSVPYEKLASRLVVSAVVTHPDGSRESSSLVASEESGALRFTSPITVRCSQLGKHTVEATIAVRDGPQSERTIPLRVEDWSFWVNAENRQPAAPRMKSSRSQRATEASGRRDGGHGSVNRK